MKNVRNIFLVGYMGSGKSSMGRQLAARIGWQFVDLDAAIESKAGKSINTLFEENGEPAFRSIETAVLNRVAKKKHQVIATGGGTPLAEANFQTMQQSGTVVYLKVPISELTRRLEQDRAARPLLRDKSSVELAAFIQSHLTSRIPSYEKADLIFEAEKGVLELEQILNDYSK